MSPVERLLERARSMLGRHTVYWPGAGGERGDALSAASTVHVADEWPDLDMATQAELRPLAEAAGIDVNDPAQVVSAADCSGYIAWVLGMARHRVPPQPGVGEWISTDSIHGTPRMAHSSFARSSRPCRAAWWSIPSRRICHSAMSGW